MYWITIVNALEIRPGAYSYCTENQSMEVRRCRSASWCRTGHGCCSLGGIAWHRCPWGSSRCPSSRADTHKLPSRTTRGQSTSGEGNRLHDRHDIRETWCTTRGQSTSGEGNRLHDRHDIRETWRTTRGQSTSGEGSQLHDRHGIRVSFWQANLRPKQVQFRRAIGNMELTL